MKTKNKESNPNDDDGAGTVGWDYNNDDNNNEEESKVKRLEKVEWEK